MSEKEGPSNDPKAKEEELQRVPLPVDDDAILEGDVEEILETIEDPDAKRKVEVVLRRVIMRSGPIPSADQMARYEEIQPGSVQWILEHAQREQAHRHSQESHDLKSAITYRTRTLVLSFIACLVLTAAAYAFATMGYPWLSATILSTTIIGVIKVFFIDRPKE